MIGQGYSSLRSKKVSFPYFSIVGPKVILSLTGRAGGEFGNKGLATGTGLPLGDRLAAAFVLTDEGLTGALVSLDAGGSFHFAGASITLLYPCPPPS